MTTLTTYILPVSGPQFPLQLFTIRKLSKAAVELGQETAFIPDGVLASSGGTVASILGIGARWNYRKLDQLLYVVSSEKVFSSWAYGVPGYVNILTVGSIFTVPTNINTLITDIIPTKRMLFDTELVIGTFNTQLRIDTNFSTWTTDTTLYTRDSVAYCDYNFEAITKASVASFALPFVLPPEKITTSDGNDYTYQDGGLYAPSPYTSLGTKLMTNVDEFDVLDPPFLKFIYFVSCINAEYTQIFFLRPISDLINSACIREIDMIIQQFIVRVPNHIVLNIAKATDEDI